MAITRVNSYAIFSNDAVGATTIAAEARSLTSGNLIVVMVRSGNSQTVTAITDTAGNTYALATVASGGGTTFALWYAFNVTGHASNVVTATYGGTSTFNAIGTVQYSGVSTTAPLDVTAFADNGGATTSVTSAAFTTTHADTVIVGWAQANATANAWTADTADGYTDILQDTGGVTMLQEKIATAIQTGAQITATTTAANRKLIVVGAFKDAASLPAASGKPAMYYTQQARR